MIFVQSCAQCVKKWTYYVFPYYLSYTVKMVDVCKSHFFEPKILFQAVFLIFWISLIDTPTCCKTSLQGTANQEQLD